VRGIVLPVVFLLIPSHAIKASDRQSVQHQTLKLDRIIGWRRLVSGKSGNLTWEKMGVLPHPKAVNLVRPHYQILDFGRGPAGPIDIASRRGRGSNVANGLNRG
jgi:hypothetical protein